MTELKLKRNTRDRAEPELLMPLPDLRGELSESPPTGWSPTAWYQGARARRGSPSVDGN